MWAMAASVRIRGSGFAPTAPHPEPGFLELWSWGLNGHLSGHSAPAGPSPGTTRGAGEGQGGHLTWTTPARECEQKQLFVGAAGAREGLGSGSALDGRQGARATRASRSWLRPSPSTVPNTCRCFTISLRWWLLMWVSGTNLQWNVSLGAQLSRADPHPSAPSTMHGSLCGSPFVTTRPGNCGS